MPRRHLDLGDAVTPLVAVVGPTAVGKSALAVDLALAVDGEVVNADSMQLYVGMDIGTAKIAVPERLGVPHHLLDLWPVTRTASVAEYQERALAVVAAIRGRGRVPILVGGSGLYVHALVDRWDFPGTDPQIRAALEAELADLGPEALHERLARRDPEAAASIDSGNGRRLVRALEVGQLGGSFSARLPEITDDAGVVLLGLTLPRPDLDARVEARVGGMWDDGLVDEVRGLVDQGLRDGRTASRALGYAQVLRFLDGDTTEQQARKTTVQATRRFVRRQESWFRRDPRIRWLPADDVDLLGQAVGRVARQP
ncbi:MAG TPA: tRNA (adenosine(37)-N6)-dimethylallyltransferase MiaA [Actinomycetes bacterium]|nr:tRNA (adenosine(37)-N6)-dimethylallyltransferase MiaA [Actinomycetes bacterium]